MDLLTPEQRADLASLQATCDSLMETYRQITENHIRRCQQLGAMCEALSAANNQAADDLEEIGEVLR